MTIHASNHPEQDQKSALPKGAQTKLKPNNPPNITSQKQNDKFNYLTQKSHKYPERTTESAKPKYRHVS